MIGTVHISRLLGTEGRRIAQMGTATSNKYVRRGEYLALLSALDPEENSTDAHMGRKLSQGESPYTLIIAILWTK